MDKKEILNRIEYVVCCVGAFASRFNLTNAQAYAYLRRFSGIDFLLDCYAAEHTLSIEDALEDLTHICLQKGGQIAWLRFIMGYISIEKLIEELKYKGNHSVQYFFATEAAINLLKKVELWTTIFNFK